MKLKAKVFESKTKSWETMCEEISEFASGMGPDRLVNVSMSATGGIDLFGTGSTGTAIVWYWE